MKYKTVIWDFNGTILDDTGISMDAMNIVLERRNLKRISSISEFRHVFGFPVKDYYERIGLDFSKEPYKIPADEWIALYNERMYSAPLIENAREALDLIRSAGISQMILSASETNRLKRHLERLGITEYFDEIHGADDVYAKGKDERARDLSKRKELFPSAFIGDTDHDAACADLCGCDAYLFSGGFMSAERLAALGVPVFESLFDIAKIIISKE